MIIEMSEAGKINELCDFIEESKKYLRDEFLNSSMKQALAVDETLGKMIK